MSKIIAYTEVCNNKSVELYDKLHIVHIKDGCSLVYNGKTIDEIKCNKDDYLSVKLNYEDSKIMVVKLPINKYIRRAWMHGFMQKHRFRTEEEYNNFLSENPNTNPKRITSYEICEPGKYNFFVRRDNKYNVVLRVAFWINIMEDIDIDQMEIDINELIHCAEEGK